MQGHKGVGRNAGIYPLVQTYFLETVNFAGEKTQFIWMEHFESIQYLDDVEILVETGRSLNHREPRLTWTEMRNSRLIGLGTFHKLRFELRNLKLAVSASFSNEGSGWRILVIIEQSQWFSSNRTNQGNYREPYPLLTLLTTESQVASVLEGDGNSDIFRPKTRNTIRRKNFRSILESLPNVVKLDIASEW